MSTTEPTEAPNVPDYSVPREWLADEGYYRADLQTGAQLRKAAAELLERGRELVETAEDALAEIERAERQAAYESSHPATVQRYA